MTTVLVSFNNCGSLYARCTSPCLLMYDFCKYFVWSDPGNFCPINLAHFQIRFLIVDNAVVLEGGVCVSCEKIRDFLHFRVKDFGNFHLADIFQGP